MSYDGPVPLGTILPPPVRTALERRCKALYDRVAPCETAHFELGAYSEEDPRAYLEPVLHEIAHVVVLRRGLKAALDCPLETDIGRAVPRFPEIRVLRSDPVLTGRAKAHATRIANKHEIDTIAVEVIASREIAMSFDPMDIAIMAVDGENVRDMNADTCVALIERAMSRHDFQRWGRAIGRALTEDT